MSSCALLLPMQCLPEVEDPLEQTVQDTVICPSVYRGGGVSLQLPLNTDAVHWSWILLSDTKRMKPSRKGEGFTWIQDPTSCAAVSQSCCTFPANKEFLRRSGEMGEKDMHDFSVTCFPSWNCLVGKRKSYFLKVQRYTHSPDTL